MSDARRLEQMTREFLELGPTRAPDEPIRAALRMVQRTPQERDFGFRLRPSQRWLPLRLAMAAAIVVVALVGVGQLRLPTGNVGGGPSPSATASPAVTPNPSLTPSPSPTPLDTTTWLTFTSDRYGVSVLHPADWVVTRASEFWDLQADRNMFRVGLVLDTLVAPSNNPQFHVFSMGLPPGTSEDAFLAEFSKFTLEPDCIPPRVEWAPITIDGRPALLVANTCSPYAVAFAFVDGRVYGFRLFDRAQYPDGPLFRTILSTVRLNPGDALEAPSPAPSASPGSSPSPPTP